MNYQEVNGESASRVESTAATQQTAKVVLQVNGINAQAESEPAHSLPL